MFTQVLTKMSFKIKKKGIEINKDFEEIIDLPVAKDAVTCTSFFALINVVETEIPSIETVHSYYYSYYYYYYTLHDDDTILFLVLANIVFV